MCFIVEGNLSWFPLMRNGSNCKISTLTDEEVSRLAARIAELEREVSILWKESDLSVWLQSSIL